MNSVILTMWLTTFVWSIIPNIILINKLVKGKCTNVFNAGFVHFMSLFLFVCMSIVATANLIHSLL